MPTLLVVHHTASPSLHSMFEAVMSGAKDERIEGVDVVSRPALAATAVDVLAADGRAKRPRRQVLAAALGGVPLVATLLVAGMARAGVSIAILFEELLHDAAAAAVVTPIEQLSVWENGRIFTYTRVHVEALVAGQLPGEPWVRTMGGEVGRIAELVDGEPVLAVGRPSLLFLQPQVDRQTSVPTGAFEVTARAQGQFPVGVDEQGSPVLLHAYDTGRLLPPPAARLEHVARQNGGAAPRFAREALHRRLVSDAASEIAAAWGRLHAPSK